jgi:hypothetical protein
MDPVNRTGGARDTTAEGTLDRMKPAAGVAPMSGGGRRTSPADGQYPSAGVRWRVARGIEPVVLGRVRTAHQRNAPQGGGRRKD